MSERQIISVWQAASCWGGWLVCALLAFSAKALAVDDQPERKADGQQAIGQLIQQLGEASFEARERATQQLVEIGSPAEPALANESSNPDPEIQYRCRHIIAQIGVRNFERRLEGFLAKKGESGDHRLPGWTRFQRSYGSAQAAKELFVSMQRAEPELIKNLEENRDAVAGLLNERVTAHQQRMRFQQIELPSLATILFVAAEDDIDVGMPASQLVTSFCYQPSFREGIAAGSQTHEALQKMLERWLSRDNEFVAQQGVMLAMQFDLPVGVHLAKRILQDDKGAKHMQLYALLAIAKLGDKNDPKLQDLLTGKLDDKTPLSKTAINNQTLQTEARDVALVALLHLQQQDLKKFGFVNVQEQPIYLYAPHTLGFENDEQRAVAFEKWKAFSEKKKE